MELVTLIQNGGPLLLACVFAYLFWAEREDHKKTQRDYHEFKDRFIERGVSAIDANARATKDNNESLEALTGMFRKVFFQLRNNRTDSDVDQ